MSPAPEHFPPGTLLAGKYRIQRQLGEGGMGRVYLAQHIHLEHPVAVKVLLPQYAEDAGIRERFLREARAAAKLKSPHASEVLDVGVATDALPFFVMEYLEGHDLHQHIAEVGHSAVPLVVDLMLQALDALAEAHSMQLVHRDLKPENLFLTQRPGGSPLLKVLDFGISKDLTRLAASSLTAPSTVLGSPQYMAPEQMQAHEVDHRADIWALGAILYELLCGQRAFDGESLPEICSQVLSGPPKPLRSLAPDLPEPLYAVVDKCLSFDAAGRYADVGQLASALCPFLPRGAEDRVEKIRGVLRGHAALPKAGAFPVGKDGTLPPSPTAPTVAVEGPQPAITEASMELGPTELQDAAPPGRRSGVLVGGCLLLAGAVFWLSRSEPLPRPNQATPAQDEQPSHPSAARSSSAWLRPEGETAGSQRSPQTARDSKEPAPIQPEPRAEATATVSADAKSPAPRPRVPTTPADLPKRAARTREGAKSQPPSTPEQPSAPASHDAWNTNNFGGRH